MAFGPWKTRRVMPGYQARFLLLLTLKPFLRCCVASFNVTSGESSMILFCLLLRLHLSFAIHRSFGPLDPSWASKPFSNPSCIVQRIPILQPLQPFHATRARHSLLLHCSRSLGAGRPSVRTQHQCFAASESIHEWVFCLCSTRPCLCT